MRLRKDLRKSRNLAISLIVSHIFISYHRKSFYFDFLTGCRSMNVNFNGGMISKYSLTFNFEKLKFVEFELADI